MRRERRPKASLAMPTRGRAGFAGAAGSTPVARRPASLDAARPDVCRGVPARDAGDLDDVAGVRRVDEGVAADVDADVAEPVEEDQVARLEVAARDRAAHAVLRVGAV